jgi:hypothetical protein
VIIPDVNLLLYAVIDAFPQHEKARQWWEDTVNSDEAARHIEAWLELPNVRWARPGPGHHARALGYIRAAGTAGNLTTAAHPADRAFRDRRLRYPTRR